MKILKQSHSVKKSKKGDHLGFLKLQFVAKYQKIEGGSFEDKKMQKSLTTPKKWSLVSLVSSCFVCYV